MPSWTASAGFPGALYDPPVESPSGTDTAARALESRAAPKGPRVSAPPDARADRALGREAWRVARTFEDLCRLGAAFLELRCAHFPGFGAPHPDAETDEIRVELVALHGRGFLSVASQPAFEGARDGRDTRQRAFVAGFARADLARRWARSPRIAVRAWFADGVSIASAAAGAGPETVTSVDGAARVLTGHPARDAELELFADDVGAEALGALAAAAYVTAWDPVYGRRADLWRELSRLADA